MKKTYLQLLAVISVLSSEGFAQTELNDPSKNAQRTEGFCVLESCKTANAIIDFPAIQGRYEGNFSDGVPNGLGTLQLRDNVKFSGVWRSGRYLGACILGDCLDGIGVFNYSGSTVLISRDLWLSVNRIKYGDKIYSGEFKAGKRHGRGCLNDGQGIIWATYKNDVMHGEIESWDPSLKRRFKGLIENGVIRGQGTHTCGAHETYKNCEYMTGNFKDGDLSEGMIKYKSGIIFEGIWSKRSLFKGKIICPSGKEIKNVQLDYHEMNVFKCK